MTKTTEKTKVAELEMDVKELYDAIRKLKRVTPRTPKDMPILGYALMRQRGPAEFDISISGTDLEKATTIELDAEVEQIDREFLIPTYKAWDILKGEDGTVKIEHYIETSQEQVTDEDFTEGTKSTVENHTTVLTVNGIEFELFVGNEEDYAQVPLAVDMELIELMDYDRVKDILYEIEDFALNTSETTRHSLTGLYFSPEGDVAATNGYYMAIEDIGDFDGKFILGDTADIKKQRVTLKKIDSDVIEIREIKNENGDIEWIMLTDPDWKTQLLFTPISEEYPDYEAVIPANNEYKIELTEQATDELYNFCNKVGDLSSKDDPEAVKIKITEDSNKLELSHSNPDIGELHSTVEIGNKSSINLEITAKGSYIANILDKEDSFDLWVQDSDTALLFLDTDRMYVCMPISEEG